MFEIIILVIILCFQSVNPLLERGGNLPQKRTAKGQVKEEGVGQVLIVEGGEGGDHQDG